MVKRERAFGRPAGLAPAELVVDAIEVRRGGTTLVNGVSFTLQPGEIAAVIGANGAGKTTLLEAVVGRVHPAAGRVTYAGVRLDDLKQRARVFSFMPDAGEPAAEMRVSSLVRFAGHFGRVGMDEALRLARRLGLDALLGARAGELSMGEKKRVSLHAALCTDRPVVVLDEPLGTFDPLQLLDVLDVLRGEARAGRAVLLSVHQMSDAEKIAARILLLDRGRLIASGTLDALRTAVALPSANLEQVFLRILEGRHAGA